MNKNKTKLSYHTIMSAELSPTVLGEEIEFEWDMKTDGDFDSEKEKVLTLDAKQFPPGTRIIIEVPECPECSLPSEYCFIGGFEPESECPDCDFDWKEWTLNKYS